MSFGGLCSRGSVGDTKQTEVNGQTSVGGATVRRRYPRRRDVKAADVGDAMLFQSLNLRAGIRGDVCRLIRREFHRRTNNARVDDRIERLTKIFARAKRLLLRLFRAVLAKVSNFN